MTTDDIFLEAEDIDLSKTEVFPCKWSGCVDREHRLLALLVSHVTNTHLSQYSYANPNSVTVLNQPVKYACQWEGCQRIGAEQPSRFALISHCRTHTGEKPFFCPIPECEKHFTRLDALTKHVKGVHDLHVAKDALFLIKERTKKTRGGDIITSITADTTEHEYLDMVDDDYNLRLPWWFTKLFVLTNKPEKLILLEVLDAPLDTQQYKVARRRVDAFINEDERVGGGETGKSSGFIEGTSRLITSFAEAAQKLALKARESSESLELSRYNSGINDYKVLKNRYKLATKINSMVTTQLDEAVRVKRKLWLACQVLLDANVEAGLPEKGEGALPTAETSSEVVTDIYDDELLEKD